MKANSKQFKISKAHAITGSKMHSTPQPEQHHRINQSPLSLESGLGTENLTAELNKKDIGLFQGCVLSTILFDCVFQLLLDFLKPVENLGYTFKSAPEICIIYKAYADDLTLVANNAKNNQVLCDRTNVWLNWTVTMPNRANVFLWVSRCLIQKLKMNHLHL